jgi:hypothetical protein
MKIERSPMLKLDTSQVIGIPLLAFGWWMRSRGLKNVQIVETGWAEFMGSTPAAV